MATVTHICTHLQYRPQHHEYNLLSLIKKEIKDLDQTLPESSHLLRKKKHYSLLLDITKTYKKALLIYCLCKGFKLVQSFLADYVHMHIS